MSLAPFFATGDELASIEEHFERHHVSLKLDQRSPSYLATLPRAGGVYCIVGQRADVVLKIYVGQATSLRKRIDDYHRAFQPQCPPDRKLAFFQEWLNAQQPGWDLQLFIKQVDEGSRRSVETEWINKLQPLVNATVRADDAARQAMEGASRDYFWSFFSKRVSADG